MEDTKDTKGEGWRVQPVGFRVQACLHGGHQRCQRRFTAFTVWVSAFMVHCLGFSVHGVKLPGFTVRVSDSARGAMLLISGCYAACGTELAYGAMRCA
eukprot:1519227-Rhodomonas_salina.1